MKIIISQSEACNAARQYYADKIEGVDWDSLVIEISTAPPSLPILKPLFNLPPIEAIDKALDSIATRDCDLVSEFPDRKIHNIKDLRELFAATFMWYVPLAYAKYAVEDWIGFRVAVSTLKTLPPVWGEAKLADNYREIK